MFLSCLSQRWLVEATANQKWEHKSLLNTKRGKIYLDQFLNEVLTIFIAFIIFVILSERLVGAFVPYVSF